ncbi:EamA family transporter [Heliobacillus mobilis]|uniref:EamA family transporter n=1 Tax=Heliobacterium mobile TaxID=28064 RepID=A0A6I3SKI7_HELMO|nr:DMT family transporter [Heliobacterium mobile]MTV49413.1 EamA family transporter [Heliobacterium mobile]
MHQKSWRISPLAADVVLLSVAAIWGGTFVAVKNAIAVIPPYAFLAIRFFIAALFLAVFTAGRWSRMTRATGRDGFLLGGCLFGGYALQTIGLQYTTSSNAGFITGLSVVMVPLITWVILKERPRSGVLAGVALSIAGLGFLTLTDTLQINPGDLLVLGCSVCFGLHIYLAGQVTRRHDPILLTVSQLVVVAIACSVFSSVWEPPLAAGNFQYDVWLALALTAIPATSLAFLAQMHLQKYTTATRTALIFATEPVFSLIFAIILAGEMLTIRGGIGCFLVLAGIVTAELVGSQEEKAEPAEREALFEGEQGL